ncbi:MAG: DUF1538 domain-containing protein [Thermodesulfovibrionales bacterium]|nr:DUF1538 domain-containing protein [Thermodesulfovibrionales bacterium]
MRTLKYSEYLKETERDYLYVSYNLLNPKDISRLDRIEYSFNDAIRIIKPYVKSRWNEQFKVVVPISLYLLLFELLILRQPVSEWLLISVGILAIIVGLMMFMEGLKVGLMPFGETIGYYLPIKAKINVVLIIAFILGIGATFAEPAIGVLREAGRIVSPDKAPILHAMLTYYAHLTVIAVALGVGFAVLSGLMMFIFGWSLKPLIFVCLLPTLAISIYCATDPLLSSIIGLAWDCGAVTTGPVTVPLVLSLSIGTAGVIKHHHSNKLQGFGVVTLASLLPIFAVLFLGVFIKAFMPLQDFGKTLSVNPVIQPYASTILQNVLTAMQAVVPLVLFLYIIQSKILKEHLTNKDIIIYGIVLCVLGMSAFNIGLSFGLSVLGNQVGSLIPSAYTFVETVKNSPLYVKELGLAICFVFAFFLGYGATLAEPALNALGITVENITNGAFKKIVVMMSVSIGVGVGILIGVIKIIFDIPIIWLITPSYIIAGILTIITEERYVNLAWDSAGVTTGPITVPLVLALGLGFANVSGALDGFGILAMASVCPIISVLLVGLYIQVVQKRRLKEGFNE